jgi:peptidoglycan hydrolase CwlO-like protein
MDVQNKSSLVSYVLIVLLTIGIIYLLTNRSESSLIDTSHYDKKVDSLNVKIENYESKIDSMNNSIDLYLAKTTQYEADLANLKNKIEKNKKQYEKDINRINSMSNTDISREFTDAFK